MSERFTIAGRGRDPADGAFTFAYRCSRFGPFVERVTLPAQVLAPARLAEPATEEILRTLHAALGVSYYKAAAAGEIVFEDPPRTTAARRLVEALYRDGLGEFFVRNGLAFPPGQRFVYGSSAVEHIRTDPPVAPSTPPRAVLAWGGGKDSHVAKGLLRERNIEAELVSAVLSDKVADVLATTVSQPIQFLRRRIDPALIAANSDGALNGHVPITAVNSLIAALYAWFSGRDWVVFANERSADEGTRTVNGHAVNHQFSKTLQCERLIRDALNAAGGRLTYFSLLRPFSELWIARRIAAAPEALRELRSCNRNFFIAGGDGRRWCGECAKCAFTALITAPFLTRAQSREVFGADILDDERVWGHVADMAGLTDTKPWDCVGEVSEVRAALHRLSMAPDWRDARLVARAHDAVSRRILVAEMEGAWRAALETRGPSCLPAELADLAT